MDSPASMANAPISVLQLVPPPVIALVKFTQLVKIHMLFSEMLKSLSLRPMMEMMLEPMQMQMVMLVLVLDLVTSSADSITSYPDTITERMCESNNSNLE